MSALGGALLETQVDRRHKENMGVNSNDDTSDIGPDDGIFEIGLFLKRSGKRYLKKGDTNSKEKCEEMLGRVIF